MKWIIYYIKTVLAYIDGDLTMSKYNVSGLGVYRTGRVTVGDTLVPRDVAMIKVSSLPDFCGGKYIHDMWVRDDLPNKDRKEVLELLFSELKKIHVAKLIWADRVDGYIHKAVTEVYPDSEVGSIKRNPNSNSDIIVGELNIGDM